MTAGGDFQWPPTGRFSWPPSSEPRLDEHRGTRIGITALRSPWNRVRWQIRCRARSARTIDGWASQCARTSQALEQTGTEFDCSASGEPQYSAWYELVPAPGKDIAMTVEPGDAMDAAVTADKQRVTILLRDRTRHETFKRTFTMKKPDVSTAEGIVEAPSACDSSGTSCQQLPVSNFGTLTFQKARATTVKGHIGTVTDSAWAPTTIELSQSFGNGRFRPVASAAGATPSSLSGDGSSFSVSYTEPQSATDQPTYTPGTGGGRFPWTLPRR